jgi:hypothetical protein
MVVRIRGGSDFPLQTRTADYLQGSISKLVLAVAVPILFVTFKG